MPTESVKIDTAVIAKVRRQKKKSGINVGKFFELAALEKLERDKPFFLTRTIPIEVEELVNAHIESFEKNNPHPSLTKSTKSNKK